MHWEDKNTTVLVDEEGDVLGEMDNGQFYPSTYTLRKGEEFHKKVDEFVRNTVGV